MRKKVVLILLLIPLWVLAETELTDTIQEILVMSSRIGQLENNVAVAQSTVFLKQIETEQRLNYKDLSSLVPNLYVPDYGSAMTSSVYVRGLGARVDNPVMGMYVDGIAIANKNSYDNNFIDIRSVDVFRGPQGTLFGRNTIGGVMNINTLSPLDYQGTRASVGYGNHNTAEIKASHYRLLSDHWGLSAAAYYHYTDGFFRNTFDNTRADQQYMAGARLKADGITSDGTRINNQLSYNFVKQSGFPYHLPDSAVSHNDFCGYTRHNLLAASAYNIPLDKFVLNGSTSYQFLWDDMQMDQDYLPLSYFTLEQQQQEHFVNQELTLRPKTKQTEHWNWLTGFSASYRHQRMSAPVLFKSDGIQHLILDNANSGMQKGGLSPCLVLQEDEFLIGSRFITQNVDAALYHTSYFNWGGWLLEAGLRLDFEYLHFNYNSDATIHYRATDYMPQYSEVNTVVEGKTSLTYCELLPRLAVSYSAKEKVNWSVYASVSEGYKAGGFNTQLFSDILQQQLMLDMMQDMGVIIKSMINDDYVVSEAIKYKPERCLNFEIGGKISKQWDNSLLNVSLSLYELEVFNQQLTVFPQKGTGRFMTNAGHSRSMGGEMVLQYAYKDLTLRTSYGYTNARFVKYDNGKQSFDGNLVPYIPSNTISAAIEYSIPLNHSFFHNLVLNVNTDAVGSIYWDEENSLRQPLYAMLGANLTLKMKNVDWQIWGKNLTNTKYDVFHFVSMGNHFMQSGKPIRFGTSLLIEI